MACSSSCRTCGRPVVWARLPRGRAVPLDPEPDARGQVILLGDGRRALHVDPATRYGADVQARRHWNHLSTCRGFTRVRPGETVAGASGAAAGADPRRERVRELRVALRRTG